jgi:hypothetical protein
MIASDVTAVDNDLFVHHKNRLRSHRNRTLVNLPTALIKHKMNSAPWTELEVILAHMDVLRKIIIAQIQRG